MIDLLVAASGGLAAAGGSWVSHRSSGIRSLGREGDQRPLSDLFWSVPQVSFLHKPFNMSDGSLAMKRQHTSRRVPQGHFTAPRQHGKAPAGSGLDYFSRPCRAHDSIRHTHCYLNCCSVQLISSEVSPITEGGASTRSQIRALGRQTCRGGMGHITAGHCKAKKGLMAHRGGQKPGASAREGGVSKGTRMAGMWTTALGEHKQDPGTCGCSAIVLLVHPRSAFICLAGPGGHG